MVTVPYSTIKSRLLTELRDPNNITWTAGEVDECLTTAFSDPVVSTYQADDSLITITGQNTYDFPGTMNYVFEIFIDAHGDGAGVKVDRSRYELVNGQIVFDSSYTQFPVGKAIIVFGRVPSYDQTQISNAVIPDWAVEYVLKRAMLEAYSMLRTSLTSRFLRNKVTMPELLQSIASLKGDLIAIKQSMPKRSVSL